MQPDESYFTPEEVDTQIDRFLEDRSGTTPARRLIHDLQAHYAAEAADAPALARVWTRIQKRDGKLHLVSDRRSVAHNQGDTAVSNEQPDLIPALTQPAVYADARRSRSVLRSLGSIVAAVLVVALAVTVFALHPGNKGGSRPAHTPSATATRSTTWVHVSGLDAQQALPLLGYPVPSIAPSNPKVVYELYSIGSEASYTVAFRRTDDGGETWQDLTLPAPPPPADPITTSYVSFVSPLDPNTVFLGITKDSTSCLIGPLQSLCAIQYISTDGGAHWQLQHLPFDGVFAASLGTISSVSMEPLRVQGTRLYMDMACRAVLCSHIVASSDGGKTWNVVDTAIANSGQFVTDFEATPTGSTIVALATTAYVYNNTVPYMPPPLHLWQSDNAGATWRDEGIAPTPNLMGMAITTGSDPSHPLVYSDLATVASYTKEHGILFPVFSTLPSDIKVTADGGTTWQSAPDAGIPSTTQVLRLLGALNDGSILIECTPDANGSEHNGSTYYTWKLGAASWQQLGNPLTGFDLVGQMIVTSGNTPGGTVWLLTIFSGDYGNQVSVYTIGA